MKRLNIRPDTGVYGTYKRISYEPWTALAEFVDNSTQSFYDHKDELYKTKYYKGLKIEISYIEDQSIGDEIIIKDNAFGMEYKDFQRAIILDRPPMKTNGRNEFGMGLKAAACWFGNLWSVETTSLGSNIKYRAEVDIDCLIKYKNEYIDVEEEKVNPNEHYTIIKIQRLNKKIKGKRIEKKIHELLSSIYRCDLRTGDIKIYYNGNLLEFEEVKPYVDENKKEWKKDIEFDIPYHNEQLHVNGFIAIRIPGDVKNAGFTLLRRGRVIIGGPDKNYRPREVFGAANSFSYQRLYGELEMDNWPVTQAKDSFDWSNEDLESKLIDKLVEVTREYKINSDNLRVREKTSIKYLKDKLASDFNNNGFVTDLDIVIKDDKETVKNVDIVAVDYNNKDYSDKDSDIVNESVGDGVEIEDNKPILWKMKYRGREYNLEMVFNQNDYKSAWLQLEPIDKENGKYRLILNIKHPFFFPFIQKKDFLVVLAKFATALAIAEINSYQNSSDGKIDPSSIRIAMDKVLEDFINE